MTNTNPDDFFGGGGGAPTFKFVRPGDTVTGRITDLKVVQQRAYAPSGLGELKTWPSGDPMMQLNVTLQTTLRDPAVDDDDGKRRVYVDGRRIRETVKEALAATGAAHLEVGGDYTQTFTGYDPESKNPANPAKLYSVTYTRPQPGREFFANAATTAPPPAASPAAQAPAQVAQPAAPAPAAAPPAPVDESALQAALANLSPEVRAALMKQNA